MEEYNLNDAEGEALEPIDDEEPMDWDLDERDKYMADIDRVTEDEEYYVWDPTEVAVEADE